MEEAIKKLMEARELLKRSYPKAIIDAVNLGKLLQAGNGKSKKLLSKGGNAVLHHLFDNAFVQIEYVYGDAGTLIQMHTHASPQLIYVCVGEADIYLKDKIISLKRGESYTVPENTPHEYLFISTGQTMSILNPPDTLMDMTVKEQKDDSENNDIVDNSN